MAQLDQYWKQISDSEKFKDLEPDQQEKVRQHLFDTYIQKAPSYQGLAQSQRTAVKKHFDDTTQIVPESMADNLQRRGKKLIEDVRPQVKAAKDVVKKIGLGMDMGVEQMIEPAPMRKGYQALSKVSEGITKGADALGEQIEPTDQQIAEHVQGRGEMTDFDVARMVASGGVRTAGRFLAGAVPTTYPQTASYAALDAVIKFAGTTFLGRDIHLPGWKPKTGLSSEAVSIGDDFEKIVTKRRLENNLRNARGGPSKPLEILAREEEKVAAQSQVEEYEDWLKKYDAVSPQGGEPAGDLHPENKVNVSQLRDAAKERLQKLKNEPVRVETLRDAEDALWGYYRTRASHFPAPGEVIQLPGASVPRETPAMLPAGPEPAGLLGSGKTEPMAAAGPAAAGGGVPQLGMKGYKAYLTDKVAQRLPGETKQAVQTHAGAMLSALRDGKFIDAKNPKPLDKEMMGFLDKFVEHSLPEQKAPPVPDSLAKLRAAAGFPPEGAMDNKERSLFSIVSELGKNLGEKGQIGGEIDPVRQARVQANVEELVDRAMKLGYETTQDIMLYAAKNAPAEIQDALRKNLSKTLSPFDSHAYKEMEAAKAGDPTAKKSLMDSAIQDYLNEKAEGFKGFRRRRAVSKIIGQFHDGDEARMRLKNDLFMHDYYRKFSENEASAMRWYLEGKAPKIESLMRLVPNEADAKEMLRLFHNPSDLMKSALEPTKVLEDEFHDLMSEFYDSMGYRENHVTRRWKQPDEYMSWEGRALGDRPNFMKGRKLLTQADGIDAGLEPKSLSIKDDLRASNDVRTRLLTRLHDLRKIAATFDTQGRPSIFLEGEGGQSTKAQITPHTGKAPAEYLRYKGVPLLNGLAINPDYKPAIDYIMGSRYKGQTIESMEHLSSLSKASYLGFSAFHPYSLAEMLVGSVSYRDVFTFNMQKNVFAKTLRNFAKAATADLDEPLNFKSWTEASRSIDSLYKSFMSGHAALSNRSLALDMAEHGFKLGSVDEINYNLLSRHLMRYEDTLKAWAADPRNQKVSGYFSDAKKMSEGVRSAIDIFNKALWDYQRPLVGMALYENHLADNIRVFNLDAAEGAKIPIDQIKFSTANMISKMVGGISMGTLLLNPKTQQMLQWAFLAPEWTIGRILVPAAAAFDRGPEGRQARKSLLRMTVGYGVFGNLMNYHNSQKYLGKGYWMHENDPGHETEVFWKTDKDGRKLYVQGSKVLTESYDDLTHPMKTASYKLNRVWPAAGKIIDWAKDSRDAQNPMKTATQLFLPGTAQGQSAYGTFPVHKGASKGQVMDLFDKFYSTGNDKFLDQAMRIGMESGFDVTTLARAAKGRHTSGVRKTAREEMLR